MKRVGDVMTRQVVVVQEATPFKQIVGLMRQHRVSAVPVLDGNERLVGIVSEDDLLLKEEDTSGAGFLGMLPVRRRRVERAKAQAIAARELMTTNVITIDVEAAISRAARLMHEHGVKRLPVVDESNRVVGIVSRADLLRVFLRADREIALDVENALTGPGWVEPGKLRVAVLDGVATLEGQAERRSQIPILSGIARAVDGVVDVETRLGYEVDDVTPRPELISPWHTFAPTLSRR